jgi:hypothetical protein
VSSKGIAALAKLEHLEEFLYHHDQVDIYEDSSNAFYLCLKRMADLKVSGLRVKIDLKTDRLLTGFASSAFERLKKPLPTNQLALRELVLKRASEMPVGVVLPDLKTLYLISPGRHFSLLGLLSLTELGLEEVKQQLFEQILTSIGHQLLSLAVSVKDTLYVDRVFQMCPKLQKLFITDLPRTFFGLNEPLGEHECLVEFGFAKKHFKSQLSHFEPEHLLQILQAMPNLSVWRIRNYFFSMPECKLISEALEKSEILQNLELFNMVNNVVGDDENSDDDDSVATSLKADNKVLRSLIDHCPKLSTVELKMSYIY